MRVRVRLFARYREATGRERVDVDLPDGGTVETAWTAMVARHPELARYRPYTLFAVGHDYVDGDHRLHPDDELCLFPPVSGGSSAASGDIYRVVDAPLSPDAIAAEVDDPIDVTGGGGAATADGREETELIVGMESMVAVDIVVTNGEERVRTVPRELRMAVDHCLPGRLHGTAVGKIDVHLLSPGGFTVPGEEAHADAHG